MRKKEIIRCGCKQCSAHHGFNKVMNREANRKVRHLTNLQLKVNPLDFTGLIVSRYFS